MSSVNQVMLLGRLGQDPDVKDVGNSVVCNFSLATSERYKDKTGEWVERTEWHRINVWGPQAESCGKFLSKGRQACVIGKLQTREYTDKDGNQRKVTEIKANNVTFVGGKEDGAGGGRGQTSGRRGRRGRNEPDELPF